MLFPNETFCFENYFYDFSYSNFFHFSFSFMFLFDFLLIIFFHILKREKREEPKKLVIHQTREGPFAFYYCWLRSHLFLFPEKGHSLFSLSPLLSLLLVVCGGKSKIKNWAIFWMLKNQFNH